MAFPTHEYFVTDAGAGTQDGLSEGNAFSFATFTDYMVTGGSLTAAAGDRFNIIGTITSRTTNTDAWINGGTATSPVVVRGRKTGNLEAYAGRTNGNGALITTDFPTLTYTTGRLNVTGTFIILENLNITSAASNATVTLAASNVIKSCLVTNSSTNTAASGISLGTAAQSIIFDCDVTLSGTGGGATSAAVVAQGSNRVIASRIKSVSSAGIFCRSSAVIALNTVFTNGLIGIFMDANTGAPSIFGNTIVGNGGDGINIVTGSTALQFIFGNMITDNTGDGIDMVQTSIAGFVAYNRLRDNANSFANAGDWIGATSYGQANTDTGTTGTTATDYTNYAGNDFNLVATSPATSACIPLYMSIGALQRSQFGSAFSTTY